MPRRTPLFVFQMFVAFCHLLIVLVCIVCVCSITFQVTESTFTLGNDMLVHQVLYNDFPKLIVAAVLKPTSTAASDLRPSDLRKSDGPYACPCYSNSIRSEHTLIMSVNLKTDDPAHKWVLRGVAMLCLKDTGDR